MIERQYDGEASMRLLAWARNGDQGAFDALCRRYLPLLERWASGRLPAGARGMMDTHDVIQDAFHGALRRFDRFEDRGDGALLAYLRQAALNRIRDEYRRGARRPPHEPLDEELAAPTGSPLDEAIGADLSRRYERALQRLRPDYREAIIGHVEMGRTLEELAESLEKPSLHATRMTLRRALVRLAEEMAHEG